MQRQAHGKQTRGSLPRFHWPAQPPRCLTGKPRHNPAGAHAPACRSRRVSGTHAHGPAPGSCGFTLAAPSRLAAAGKQMRHGGHQLAKRPTLASRLHNTQRCLSIKDSSSEQVAAAASAGFSPRTLPVPPPPAAHCPVSSRRRVCIADSRLLSWWRRRSA